MHFKKIIFYFLTFASIFSYIRTESEQHIGLDRYRLEIDKGSYYRLPDTIIPSEYFIHLAPIVDPSNYKFDGHVRIVARVNRTTSRIILHMDLIQIDKIDVSLSTNDGNKVPLVIDKLSRKEKYQFLIIRMQAPLVAGANIVVEILYTGMLTTDMRGFYRSSYKVKNERRWLFGTHLQSTGARRLFPCFDEPQFKSVFHVTLHVPQNYSAISNAPVKSMTNDGQIEFESTPIMSTYLLALVITDFQRLEKNVNNVLYSVWGNEGHAYQLPYALTVLPDAIEYFQNKLDINYPLKKLELMAIPDFTISAMENWGLLFFREEFLLYDPNVTSLSKKRMIRNIVNHEVSHQWFGNLVTPKWWDFLWLSEAFAVYFQYHAVEDERHSDVEFVVDCVQPAFQMDSLSTTHSVTSNVNSPAEIESMYDLITYNKASSIVRMLEKVLGSDIFFGALKRYLRTNQYSVATPNSLYYSIEQEISSSNYKLTTNVSEFLNSWTLQPGYPVVDVRFIGGAAVLKQERFFSQISRKAGNQKWIVPINWATRDNPNFNETRNVIWFNNTEEYVRIDYGCDDWVIFNLQQTGFYRVNYDDKMWARIIRALKTENHEIIHELNRATLIDDLFNLAKVGLVDYDILLSATQYLVREVNYGPWKTAVKGLNYLNNRVQDYDDIYQYYRVYVLSLFETIYQKLGFYEIEGENEYDVLLREDILKFLCDFGHEDCVNNSLMIFERVRRNDSYLISPNHQNIIYCTVIQHGVTDNWEYLWQKYQHSNSNDDKEYILRALVCSKRVPNLYKIVIDAITLDDNEKEYAKYILTFVAYASTVGTDVVLDYLAANYEKMLEYFGNTELSQIILAIVSKRPLTRNHIEKIKNLTVHHEFTPGTLKRIQTYVESSNYELSWFDSYAPTIFDWLQINYNVI